MKLKTVLAERRSKKNKSESCFSCNGCIGNESNDKCIEVSYLACEQGLSMCTRGVIYVEDKN